MRAPVGVAHLAANKTIKKQGGFYEKHYFARDRAFQVR